MKTLWEKLTTEQQEKIHVESKLYPNTWENILVSLKKNHGSTYLLVTEAMTIWFLFSKRPFDLEGYFNLFE